MKFIIGFDPDNLDCILKELLYFCNLEVHIIDGRYCLFEHDGQCFADYDTYFKLVKGVLDFAHSDFWHIIKNYGDNHD